MKSDLLKAPGNMPTQSSVSSKAVSSLVEFLISESKKNPGEPRFRDSAEAMAYLRGVVFGE